VNRFLLLAALAPCLLHAQRDSRWEASTLFGFRSNGSMTVSTPASPSLSRASFDSASLFSFTGGYRFDDSTLVEFRYSRTNPGLTLNSTVPGFSSAKIDSSMNQFAGDFTYEFSPENSEKFRPYIYGSVGITRLTVPDKTHSRLHLGLGLGAKYWINKFLGVKVQGGWMPTIWNRTDASFTCASGPNGAACITASGSRWIHQLEFSAGPVFRF
jgi:hypothetical protein